MTALGKETLCYILQTSIIIVMPDRLLKDFLSLKYYFILHVGKKTDVKDTRDGWLVLFGWVLAGVCNGGIII